MSKWEQYEDGSFADGETEVEVISGSEINVRCNQGSGYETQHTNASFPIRFMVEMLRAEGFNVTPQDPEFCGACKRIQAAAESARYPQYVKMYTDNLAAHRREVHGQVAA